MRATVTAVIPTRDRHHLLRSTVASVLDQPGVDVEVVVVDDGGTSTASPEVVGSDPRVRIVRHESSQGVSRARNRGLAESRTPWTAFVDDDDLWAPGKLARQLDALSAVPGSGWAMCGAAHFIAGGPVLRLLSPPPPGDVLPVLLRSNCVPGGGSGVLASTDLLRELGGFAEDLAVLADWDCWLRLAEATPAAAVVRADVGYRQHRGSMAQDLDRSRAELLVLSRRHAGAARRTGSGPDPVAWAAQLERMAYRGGDRRQGRRLSRELVLRHRRWIPAARPVLGLLPQSATDLASSTASRLRDRQAHVDALQWIRARLAVELAPSAH